MSKRERVYEIQLVREDGKIFVYFGEGRILYISTHNGYSTVTDILDFKGLRSGPLVGSTRTMDS